MIMRMLMSSFVFLSVFLSLNSIDKMFLSLVIAMSVKLVGYFCSLRNILTSCDILTFHSASISVVQIRLSILKYIYFFWHMRYGKTECTNIGICFSICRRALFSLFRRMSNNGNSFVCSSMVNNFGVCKLFKCGERFLSLLSFGPQ